MSEDQHTTPPPTTLNEIVRRAPLTDPDQLPSDMHPVLRRVLSARALAGADDLDLSLGGLPPPAGLKGIDRATSLLADAVMSGSRILVVGDFDADGATSCALAVRSLRSMGAREVGYLVPNRFEFGYGLTPEIVAVAAQQSPDLIITVDNGISSIDGVRAAREQGMAVLVTDHHLPGAELPDADAIVNPNQAGDGFPGKALAGVGVIFYVMSALRAELRARKWFSARDEVEPNLAELLDLVALGTVADVVPLDHINRCLVAQGLARIRAGRCVPGIRAILDVGRRQAERAVAGDLGFAVGPRLNAAGRLEDMSLGVECLLCDDPGRTRELAGRLDELNRERREIEADMRSQAMAAVRALHLDAQGLPRGLCLFDEAWHQGVIGILASRVREQVHRPVIAFAPAGDGEIKGSARSIPGLHIRDTLDAVAARHPRLLRKFGGHAMAAGLNLHREHFGAFAAAFDQEVGRRVDDSELRGVIASDGELAPDEINLEVAELLRTAMPWGQGFPEPLFDGVFDVITQRVVGERHLKLVVTTPGSRHGIDAIAFNSAHDAAPPKLERARIAYRLDVNEYQGRRSVQLVIEQFEPC